MLVALLLAQADGPSARATETTAILPGVGARAKDPEPTRAAGLPSDAELERRGAIIGNVRIVRLPIFDTDRPEEDTRLFRLANRLHYLTLEATIRAQLLFTSGARYDTGLLAETARNLRGTRYLYDASVKPVAYRDGKVDVDVVTRDVWTLNPGVSFGRSGGQNTSGFEVEELNLLGTGARISAAYRSGVDRNSTLFVYNDNETFGTRWRTAASFSDNSDGRGAELVVERPFFALDARRAYGLRLFDEERVDSRYDLGVTKDEFQTRQQAATVSAGWSSGRVGGWVSRWTLGAAYEKSTFARTPSSLRSRPLPADRTLVYPWLSFDRIEDRFIETRNRDQIFRTEDEFLGWRFYGRLGYATPSVGADRDAALISLYAGKGLQPVPERTLLGSLTWSGRIEGGDVRNGIASAALRYYRRQSPRRLFYLSLTADHTTALDAERQLLLGGDSGLRGYPLRYQGGEGRWLLTAEQRFYTDWYPFRLVHVGGAVFFDAGRSYGRNPFGSRSQGVLKDAGIGLRLGNARSGLGNVVHIDLAFPLDGDSSIDSVQLLVQTKRSF